MNLILFDASDIVTLDGKYVVDVVDKNAIKHLLNVIKVDIGKSLRVGLLNVRQDYGTVVSIAKDSIRIQLSEKFHLPPPILEIPIVDLVVGIPRPKSLDKLLQYSASIGVGKINLLCSSRVERSYLTSHQLEMSCILHSLRLGLEQGAHVLIPEVEIFKTMGEYERKREYEDSALKLIAHPGSTDTLGSLKVNRHTKGSILVAIGPEGGWLDHEIDFFKKIGFKEFSIGNSILRTEVAAVAILSQLSLLLNDTTLRNLTPAVR